jgi:hypothetical protein
MPLMVPLYSLCLFARYGAGGAFRAIQNTLAWPILRLQRNQLPNDDDSGESKPRSVEDFGLLFRAPIAALAAVPFVLGGELLAFVPKVSAVTPCFRIQIHLSDHQSRKYHLPMDAIAKKYTDKIVQPFFDSLKSAGQKCLFDTMKDSSATAKATVNSVLTWEDERYTKERKEKRNPPPKDQVANVVWAHSTFVAAEAAFVALMKQLESL